MANFKQIIMINYFTIRIRLLVAILAATLPLSVAKADGNDKVKSNSQGWYVGIKGGVPFGFSTFSSFGHDKTRLGWAAGIYGGYRFNPIFSAELSAKWKDEFVGTRLLRGAKLLVGFQWRIIQGRCLGHG